MKNKNRKDIKCKHEFVHVIEKLECLFTGMIYCKVYCKHCGVDVDTLYPKKRTISELLFKRS